MPAEKSDLGSAARARYYAANIVLRGLIGASRLLPYGWRVPAMGWLAARVLAPLARLHSSYYPMVSRQRRLTKSRPHWT